MDPREQPESLMESIRPNRRRGPLAGFGDRHAPVTVPVSLVVLALALLFTFFYLPHWQYLGAALLCGVGAGASHFAMRKDHGHVLLTGIVAVLVCVVAIVLFATAPN